MRYRIALGVVLFVFASTPVFAQSTFLTALADTTKSDSTAAKKPKKDRPLPLDAGRMVSFTTSEGTWLSLDVKPDGNEIVFELLGDLYTMPITGGTPERITSGLAFDSQPRYSPDGSQIVFVSDRDGNENLWVMDADVLLTDSTATADSTGLQQLTKGGGTLYASPIWTPDGTYVIASKSSGLGTNKLWMYHTEGGSGVDLMADENNRNMMGAAFGPDDRYLYVATKQGGFSYNMPSFDWQVAVYDRETGEIFQLTGEVGGGFRPALSPDGQWLVYASRHESETGFRMRNLETGIESWLLYPVQRDDQESRFTRDLMPGYAFTPDSEAIIASFGGRIHRVAVPSGETQEVPFTVDVNLAVGPQLDFDYPVDDGPIELRQIRYATKSPDGTKLAYTALNDLYVRDLETGTDERLVADLNGGAFSPVWSPDGLHLAFVSWNDDEGGHVYKLNLDNKRTTRLSTVAAYYADPVWRPDGSEVIATRGPWQQRRELSYFNFVQGQGRDLIRIPADGGEATLIAPLRGSKPHFARDADRLYVYEGPTGLVSMRLDGTDRRVLVKVVGTSPSIGAAPRPLPAAEVMMGPDGQQALARVNSHLYKLIVPRVGGDAPTVNVLSGEGAAFPVEKLTTVGGEFMTWNADGSGITWALGNSFFEYNFADAKAFETAQKNKATSDDDAEEGPDSYEPTKLAINMTFERHRAQGTLVLRGARLLTMDLEAEGDGVIEDGAIVIKDNRIVEIGANADIETPSGAREIDVSGTTITPGFIDTHAHMWPARGVHKSVVWEYLANLAYGVTTTRDPQTGTTDVLTYADLVETGRLIGPRIFSTGPGIFRSENIKSQTDADHTMDRYSEYFKTGTIKQYLSGDRNVRQWLIRAAKERQIMPTTEGALDLKLNLTQVLDGYPGHEHSLPIVPLYKDVIEVMAQTKTYYTPTLLVAYGGPWAENYFYTNMDVRANEKLNRFMPQREILKITRRRPWFPTSEHVFSKLAEQANKILEAGGRVGIGSHGQLQGLGYHWELWAVASGGMTPMNALRAATIFGAEAIGVEKELGTLNSGFLADLLVMDANPLDDLENTTSLRYVMKNGILYDADTLDEVWPNAQAMPPLEWLRDQGPLPQVNN